MRKEKYFLKAGTTFINAERLESLEMPSKGVISEHVKGEFSLFKKNNEYKFKPISVFLSNFNFKKLFNEINKKVKIKNTDRFYAYSDPQNPPIIEFINADEVDK